MGYDTKFEASGESRLKRKVREMVHVDVYTRARKSNLRKKVIESVNLKRESLLFKVFIIRS